MWNSFCKLNIMNKIVFVLSFLLFFSCASNFNEQINKVSELQFDLTSLENSFYSIDQQKVDAAIEEYKHNMSQIKKYYYTDTVEKEFVQLMNSYKSIKKGGKGLSKEAENINSNLTTMKQQLSFLKADLENQLLLKDSALFYITNEERNFNLLNENITNYIIECESILSLDDSLAIKVRYLINSYKE
tara:strand:- start:31 stop:591 length:561 start_codon:yes stop_codon:yes gene_type:complete